MLSRAAPHPDLLSATLSTVGFGDVAPVSQETRAVAVVLIPFGLVIIAFVVTWSRALVLSAPPEDSMETLMHELEEAVGEERAEEGLSVFEVMAAARHHVTEMVDDVVGDSDSESGRDGDNKRAAGGAAAVAAATDAAAAAAATGVAVQKVEILRSSVWFKCLWQALKLGATAAAGAIFFKFHPKERDRLELSWVEAFYFATVTCTSVGYGDIIPSSGAGKIFLTFYMIVAALITADVLADCCKIYVKDCVGEEIVEKIIDSTTWVHKCGE